MIQIMIQTMNVASININTAYTQHKKLQMVPCLLECYPKVTLGVTAGPLSL